MNATFEADWDHRRASKTYLDNRHKLFKRPNGTVTYSLLGVEEIHCGWGIRIRAWPKGNSYVVCHNVIKEENWVDCTPQPL